MDTAGNIKVITLGGLGCWIGRIGAEIAIRKNEPILGWRGRDGRFEKTKPIWVEAAARGSVFRD
jgi:hypothetical protein